LQLKQQLEAKATEVAEIGAELAAKVRLLCPFFFIADLMLLEVML